MQCAWQEYKYLYNDGRCILEIFRGLVDGISNGPNSKVLALLMMLRLNSKPETNTGASPNRSAQPQRKLTNIYIDLWVERGSITTAYEFGIV